MTAHRRKPQLLTDVFRLPFLQADVDFVVPNLAGDLRLAIDPFLLYKSRCAEYRAAHGQLLSVFNEAIQSYARGDTADAARLLDFPEVDEIALGYRTTSICGRGLGAHLNALLLNTLGESPALVDRGVRHVEEMQLVAIGISADRVSDIAANILKAFLISYTQRTADAYGIPVTKAVPVHHVFDFDDWDWRDGYYDLPVNPLDPLHRPIILVPRRVVRVLPWINFEDYQRTQFGLFLRSRRTRRTSSSTPAEPLPGKSEIVAVTRREVERIDHYVDMKEHNARGADPHRYLEGTSSLRRQCEQLVADIGQLHTGQEHAYHYQELMFRVLNTLFEPDLIEGQKQVRTVHGTEIRDILYTNDSDKPFWEFVRNQHASLTVVFECKNTSDIGIEDIDQLASYLGDPLGYLGIMLARESLSPVRRLKCASWYNKGAPHRIIIALSDEDVTRMLQMRAAEKDPTQIVRFKYQDFMSGLQ